MLRVWRRLQVKTSKEHFWHVNFAHRGLHDISNKVPENSLLAFKLAADNGYGAELDVQLSKDGQVVVFHDNDLKRVCGIDAKVSAYDYEDLHKMKLLNTEETIPLFTDVLNEFKRGGGPLIVELKTGKRNNELCEKTYKILQDYPGIYCIESFDPMIVRWFMKNAPDVFRGQLAAGYKDYRPTYPPILAFFLSHCSFCFLNKPDFIAYQNVKRPRYVLSKRKKGVMLFAWTSRKPDIDQKLNDAVIFEKYRPELKY